ncbi:MAG TPA: carboxymuconolactone decarboxylase family protein [Gemmatimonadales bacterium]|nr:carboxymuconolactone decarboxylase family protein [Gemmatimonadales bacterium]
MIPRIHFAKHAPGVYDAMDALDTYLSASPVDQKLLHLVRLRASQVNGCAYCIDMHWKDLKALGDSDQRLYGLDAWRESPYYTDKERAALAWTESVTFIAQGQAPDPVFDELKRQFNEREVADLTLTIATINAWNRLSIAARLTPGTYKSSLGK